MKNKIIFGLFILVVLIVFSNLVYAQEINLTVEEEAVICFNESKQIFLELQDLNFSIERVNDSLVELENLYNAQFVLKKEKKKYDFSLIFPYCNEVALIKENAFNSRDELVALKKFYDEFLTSDMNTSSVDLIIDEIMNEIESERYEKVKPLIDEAYEEIINVKAEHTTLNLFYKTTTRGIKDFFYENWIYISISLGVLIIFFFIYNKAVRKWIINKKIFNLEIKKQTLKKLIQKTQKNYFEKGSMSESDYIIKTKKFSELIRDIDKDIPLLKESFIKIQRKENSSKGKKEIKKSERKIIIGDFGKEKEEKSQGKEIEIKKDVKEEKNIEEDSEKKEDKPKKKFFSFLIFKKKPKNQEKKLNDKTINNIKNPGIKLKLVKKSRNNKKDINKIKKLKMKVKSVKKTSNFKNKKIKTKKK